MKYKQFIGRLEQLSAAPAPDVWSRIEHSIARPNLSAFPRWRMVLLAATFLFLFVIPTNIVVANHNHEAAYAYLQSFGSTDYVVLASTNY